ncbi:NAD-dependent epimerase/dehydratase family protein [Rhodococcus sp. NPDC127528]|uniref:NAD-dependent epimerase/dehydratase family protein n=1 Tax=unclassified Rhodococcus (in: high G+C Gram-positive bacteria) TaxID=192944 RepID=UPI003640B74C
MTPESGGRSSHLGHVAVIGASGFIGAATLRALVAAGGEVTAVVRRPPPAPLAEVRYQQADLGDLRTLARTFEGVDVIVRAAGYTGADEDLCEQVNYVGTRNVLAAASAHGIDFVINLCTIGVFGPGPFTDVLEDTREPNPVTAVNATRAAADRIVRAHGGTTVRPGFIDGHRDRWFLPGLRHILGETRAWVDGGAALLSIISVDELGALIADLAMTCSADDRGALFHAAHPEPRSVFDIATELAGKDLIVPDARCTYAEALARAATAGLTARHIDLVGRDHTINPTRLWHRTGRVPMSG